jgi:hypothetical protein
MRRSTANALLKCQGSDRRVREEVLQNYFESTEFGRELGRIKPFRPIQRRGRTQVENKKGASRRLIYLDLARMQAQERVHPAILPPAKLEGSIQYRQADTVFRLERGRGMGVICFTVDKIALIVTSVSVGKSAL